MRVKKITIISILLLSVVFVVLSGCEIKKSNVNSKNDSETNNVEKVKKDNIETQNTEKITEKKDEMDEKNADSWSRDKLISTEIFEEFKAQKAFSASSVVAFANNIGIAPGIVVGRLQNEGCIQHNMLNDLKEQYVIAV